MKNNGHSRKISPSNENRSDYKRPTILTLPLFPRYKRARVDNSIAVTLVQRERRENTDSFPKDALSKRSESLVAVETKRKPLGAELLDARSVICRRGNDNVTSDKPPRL